MTPEAKVKASIKKALDKRGFWRAGTARPATVIGWYYMPVSNGMGVHGIPDFVCCWNGLFFSVEAKAKGGVTTANQDRRHEEIQAAKGIVLVVDEAEKLEEWMDKFEWPI